MAKNDSLLSEFVAYMMKKKKYWLLPIIISLLIVGYMIIFVQTSSVSHYVYAFI